MNRYKVLLITGLLVGVLFPFPSIAKETAKLEASVVIQFDSGKTFLDAGDKAKLRAFFQKYETGPKSRIFVVGYTDSVGDKGHNYKLSRKRAQAIRRQIISAFGLDATVVMAMGKGEENPVGDNRKASGRASNRRAEIYLVNTKIRKPAREYGPNDLYLADIETLIQEAQALTRRRQFGEAIRILKKARGLGGDHYSDWHAIYGIAGFYANAPDAEINAHLVTALKLDPYNYTAREYLGRITARQKVAGGEVTQEMGLSVENAIAVISDAQQHEYLRLFNVDALVHRQLDGYPVDIWECIDSQGVRVVYYFNHSRVYEWAFANRSTDEMSQAKSFEFPQESAALPAANTKTAKTKDLQDGPKKIWESKIFN
jgi:tetratricopeptide (TPR) repeat protein